MLIKSGFWNYYLAFRLKDYREYVNCIPKMHLQKGIIAVATENTILKNPAVDHWLHDRKEVMEKWINKKMAGELSEVEEERKMYREDILPEHYFDIVRIANGQWKDIFQEHIRQSEYNLLEKNKVFNQILSYNNTGDSYTCYAVMPVKMYLSDWEYIYCPITISLFDNGWGVLKLAVELRNVDADNFSLEPLKNWYQRIKIWDAFYSENGEEKYKILGGEIGQAAIRDIQHVCHKVIHKVFDGFLEDKDRFSGFETILLSETDPEFKNRSKMNVETQKDIFHLANAGTLYNSYSKSDYQKFWSENDFDFGDIHFVKGSQCRMLIYGNAENISNRMGREGLEDLNYYMELSVEKTFDPFIEIALCKKDNEVLVYTASESRLRDLYANMARYNRNLDYIERFMLIAPRRGKQMYELVNDILQGSFGDIEDKIERLRYIEKYQKTILKEKTELFFQTAALIFGSVFGLPAIRESFEIVHDAIWGVRDVFGGITLDGVSVVIWCGLLAAMVIWYIHSLKDYRK